MITLNLTNTSGADIVAGDGTLPDPLDWVNLTNGSNVNVVVQAGDMVKVSPPHSGFTLGDKLQQLKQLGKITYTTAAYGDTAANGSVSDGVIHNA